jgi:hypothetical protein
MGAPFAGSRTVSGSGAQDGTGSIARITLYVIAESTVSASDLPAQTEAVQALLELGADVNAKDKQGWTALRYAAGRTEIAGMLMKAGAKE